MDGTAGLVRVLLVFAGGGSGAVLRFGAGLALPQAAGAFPWTTLAVNAVGSAAMGVFLHASDRAAAGEGARLFVAVGLLGGFTTFSAYSGETLRMIDGGRTGAALAYAAASVVLCVGAAFAGHRAAAAFA
ncbi:MAG: putative fluoride ion transporter CrcB [Planctomycetes bacterium]|nr:putative fluoride ion transporter CrcB [Planctomycetota bacterium]